MNQRRPQDRRARIDDQNRRPGYQEEPWYPAQRHPREFSPSYGYPHFMEDYSLFYYPDYYDRSRQHSVDPRLVHRREHQGLWGTVKNFFGKGPKGYRRSDERIHEDVCETLTRHPDIDATEVEVEVRDGHVFLRGRVENRATKRMSEDAIDNLPGVIDVHNELRVEAHELPPAARRRGSRNDLN